MLTWVLWKSDYHDYIIFFFTFLEHQRSSSTAFQLSSEWHKHLVLVRLFPNVCGMKLMFSQALLSVYDKTDLLDLAKGLAGAGVRLLGSGGTAKKIREAGISIE